MPQANHKLLFLMCLLLSAAWQSAAAQSTGPQFAPVPPPAAGRSAAPAREIPGLALLAELKRGGYTIYFRHTSTDFSRDDVKSRSDDDCDNQRPLTDKPSNLGRIFRTDRTFSDAESSESFMVMGTIKQE